MSCVICVQRDGNSQYREPIKSGGFFVDEGKEETPVF